LRDLSLRPLRHYKYIGLDLGKQKDLLMRMLVVVLSSLLLL
jgi:hypothetical protein